MQQLSGHPDKCLLGVVHWFELKCWVFQVLPEPASPTPMETSGCAPADLCQAFSDVILDTAVRDVDADDYDNPMLCSDYVKDIYKYLRQLEACETILNAKSIWYPSAPHALLGLTSFWSPQVEQNVRPAYLQGREVTGNMRAILIDWLVQVSLKFRLLQETMYMTVGVIDRFLQVSDCISYLFCMKQLFYSLKKTSWPSTDILHATPVSKMCL